MSSPRSSILAVLAASALLAGVLAVTNPPAAAAPVTPTRPAPLPLNTSAVLPSAKVATLPAGEHIVKDDSPGTPSCTGYSSQTTPPKSIRVLVTVPPTTAPHIVVVPFEQYVENVLPNEWISSWDGEALKAGAVAVKSYAWYWVNHYGGYLTTRSPSTCFDVDDTTNFQVYRADSDQTRTNTAVQETWGVIARDADIHEVRQTGYRSSLTSAGSGEACGAGVTGNGAVMSQWGSQACAEKNLTYQQILRTYYFATPTTGVAPFELATVKTGPPSGLAAGPVVLAYNGALVAFRTAGTSILKAQQPAPLQAFGAWSALSPGPQFAGQPSAMKAFNDTLVVYARDSAGRILGTGQKTQGAAFGGWGVMGPGSPALLSDPTPLVAANGAIVIYATAGDGNVWGTGQSRLGGPFNPWLQLSTGGGFSGKPAALVTAAHQIVVYARNGATIEGAGQSVAGGKLSAFAPVGTGAIGVPGSVGDPSVVQAGDGTLSVFAAGQPSPGSPNAIWTAGQPSPGVRFGAWRQISAATTFVSAPAAHPMSGTGPIVVYAANSTGAVQGGQAPTPGSAFTAFGNMGTGTPQAVGSPQISLAANGALVLYVLGADGNLWGTGQSAPGTKFSAWLRIGS